MTITHTEKQEILFQDFAKRMWRKARAKGDKRTYQEWVRQEGRKPRKEEQ